MQNQLFYACLGISPPPILRNRRRSVITEDGEICKQNIFFVLDAWNALIHFVLFVFYIVCQNALLPHFFNIHKWYSNFKAFCPNHRCFFNSWHCKYLQTFRILTVMKTESKRLKKYSINLSSIYFKSDWEK